MTYNPQNLRKLDTPIRRKAEQRVGFLGKTMMKGGEQEWTNFPRSILRFASVAKGGHSTEKPVDLLRYLVRTFSHEGEVVLDPTMGSGSTGEAAVKENRKFIGIELDDGYFADSSDRIRRAIP